MLQVHGEMNYNGAEAVGNFRIVGKPEVMARSGVLEITSELPVTWE